MIEFLLVGVVSFVFTFLLTPRLIPKLREAGIVSVDRNKEGGPEVPEMGGLSVVGGFSFGVVCAIGLATFSMGFSGLHSELVLASLATILLMAFVGVFDDLFKIPQYVKAVLPLFAALPLVVVRAGVTTMNIPLLGDVNFAILYPLLLVPVGIAGASNVTNMFAGFNGMEAGMGVVAMLSLSVVAWHLGRIESLILLIAMAGALLAFLRYSWHPAKVFIGDVGTLSIGAVAAAAVIVGDFEMAGVIVLLPYITDFFLKVAKGLPSSGWWGTLREGKLYCDGEPVHLAQVVMKFYGGVSEVGLTLTLMVFELVCGLFTIMLFLR